MTYDRIVEARFSSRPNRFIANLDISGQTVISHVRNTGRCKELLIPGATCYAQQSDSDNRKTKYSLIAVQKGPKLINMDSTAPNRVFLEYMASGQLFGGITLIKPEQIFGDSRFDFYVEANGLRSFIEVKGVTLEENGIAMFPDAPTERGVKHLNELCRCIDEGYNAYVVFVIQMKGIKYFTPNKRTHPAFADALKTAMDYGVTALAYDCNVTKDSISIADAVSICI